MANEGRKNDTGKRLWPMLSLLTIIVSAGLGAWWLFAGEPDELRIPDEILGFDGVLVVIGLVGGFLGSFVRVLNKAVEGEYDEWTKPAAILVGFLRPAAGAMLGLFVMFVFTSGAIGMPIGDPDEFIFSRTEKLPAPAGAAGPSATSTFLSAATALPTTGSGDGDTSVTTTLIKQVRKGHAFIFAVAFLAGLVDEFVMNLVNGFISKVGGGRNQNGQKTPPPVGKVNEKEPKEPEQPEGVAEPQGEEATGEERPNPSGRE